MPSDRFDFSAYAAGPGYSDFGQAHGPGIDLRPELPENAGGIIGIDLTHIIHASDVAAAKGPGGGGGGGGGGGTSIPPYTSGPSDPSAGYNITIEFKGTWSTENLAIFKAAADKFTALIIGELQDVTVIGKGGIKVVDDILITAELGRIDGAGNILGQAGPTSIRTANSLPATATMKFDIVDVDAMGPAAFAAVVMHEMAHSLGFGAIWDRLGLVTNGFYTGESAVFEYHQMGGTLAGIRVEDGGGSGTAGSHWDEETFDQELMTGYLDATTYFTRMSAASFEDLGYTINTALPGASNTGYVFNHA